METLNFAGIIGGPHELIAPASPQALTASWVDLGSVLFVKGACIAVLWVQLDINDSINARVRALARRESGAGALEYTLPIRTIEASVVKVRPAYFEFDTDADQNMLLVAELDGAVPYVQYQVQAGVVGSTAGQIDSAYVTTSLRSI